MNVKEADQYEIDEMKQKVDSRDIRCICSIIMQH